MSILEKSSQASQTAQKCKNGKYPKTQNPTVHSLQSEPERVSDDHKYVIVTYPKLKLKRDCVITEYIDNEDPTENVISIAYYKYNLEINFEVEKDQIYLAYFNSQRNEKKPRAPKGLALYYLKQLVEQITKRFSKRYGLLNEDSRLTLLAGDIHPKHLKFNFDKLQRYYKSLGFQFDDDREDGQQTIKNFLKVVKPKTEFKEEINSSTIYNILKQSKKLGTMRERIQELYNHPGVNKDVLELILLADFDMKLQEELRAIKDEDYKIKLEKRKEKERIKKEKEKIKKEKERKMKQFIESMIQYDKENEEVNNELDKCLYSNKKIKSFKLEMKVTGTIRYEYLVYDDSTRYMYDSMIYIKSK